MNKDSSNDPAVSVPCSGNRHDLELEVITPLAQRLNCLDIKTIADICIHDIPLLIGAKFASLYVLDETSDILHLEKNNHPFPINNIVSLNQTPPTPMVAAVQSKQLMLVDNIETHKKPNISKTKRPFAGNYKTKSCIIAPLICQGQVIGVLNLSDKSDDEPFTQSDLGLMELFRQLIGASIGNVHLFEKTQCQARTDGLTGMLNHKTFYETLDTELRRSQRYGGDVSIIMADVDNLKQINDTFGHRAGDAAIKQISRKISMCIRKIDAAARYGGDEFAVILPNTSLSDAVVAAERMVTLVSESPILWESQKIKLSISVGVGRYSGSSRVDDITKATDQAMYAAKQAGKNTVKVFGQSKMPTLG